MEAGKQQFPLSETDTLTAVEKAVDSGLLAAENNFVDEFSVQGPASLLDSAMEWVNKGLGVISDIKDQVAGALLSPLNSVSGFISGVGSKLNDLLPINDVSGLLGGLGSKLGGVLPISDISGFIGSVGSKLGSFMLQPRLFARGIGGIIGSVFKIGDDIQGAINGYKRVWDTFWPGGSKQTSSSPPATPTRAKQAKNTAAIANLFVVASTLEAVRSVAIASRARDVKNVKPVVSVRDSVAGEQAASSDKSPFKSYQHAITVRDEFVEALDVIALTANDELYVAVRDLQTHFINHIKAHGANLQRTRSHQLVVTQPSLVLAHNLYGDAARNEEINVRNSVAHPGFLSAGVDLEVLND